MRPLRLARPFSEVRLGRVIAVLSGGLRRAKAVLAHHGLQYVHLAVTVIVLASAALELTFERHSIGPKAIHDFGAAIWWAIVTVTTVGFVAVALMLTGIGLLGVLTATVASFFVQQQHSEELAAMKEQLQEIRELLAAVAPEKPMAHVGSVEGDAPPP
jgi:voltage-gated potassium channel